MQWPWRKKQSILYVPVPFYGVYEDLWRDKQYLNELSNLSEGRIWISELTQLLKEIRDFQDSTTDKQGFEALKKCIDLVKMRILIGKYAKNKLNDIVVNETLNQETE